MSGIYRRRPLYEALRAAARSRRVPFGVAAGVAGTGVQTLPSLTQSASALEIISGSGAQTLPSITQSASALEIISGSGAQTLPSITQSASALEIISGSGAQTLPSLEQAASGAQGVSGSGAQDLPSLEQAASGLETISGSGAQTLPSITQVASGTGGAPASLDVVATITSVTITATGQVTVTAPSVFQGLTPKGIYVWTGNHTVDAIGDHGHFYSWGSDGTEVAGAGLRHEHDVASGNTARSQTTGLPGSGSICHILTDAGLTPADMEFQLAGDGVGSNPGPITDGWRIDTTVFTATSVTLNVLLVGGDQIECTCLGYTQTDGAGDPTSTFPHTFSDHTNILGMMWEANESAGVGAHRRTTVYNSYGCFATSDAGATIQQWAVGQREEDGQAAQDIIGIFSNQDVLAVSGVTSGHSDSNTRQYRVTTIDATDVEVTTIFGPVSEQIGVWMISIPASLDVWAGTYNLPTTGGTFTPSSQPGFEPGVYGILGSGHTNVNTFEIVEGSGAWSLGMQDEAGKKASSAIIVDGEMDAAQNTYARSLTSTDMLHHVTVSNAVESSAAIFPVATFISTGIEVASPTGTFGGLAGAFAFELSTTVARVGNAAQVLPAITQAGASTLAIPGSGLQTLPAVTQAGVGVMLPDGTGAQTLPAVTQAASGEHSQASTGTGDQALPAIIQSGAGTHVPLDGAGAQTLPAITQAGAGEVVFLGAAAQTLPALVQTGVGVVLPDGLGAQVLPAIRQAGEGIGGIIVDVEVPGSGSGRRGKGGKRRDRREETKTPLGVYVDPKREQIYRRHGTELDPQKAPSARRAEVDARRRPTGEPGAAEAAKPPSKRTVALAIDEALARARAESELATPAAVRAPPGLTREEEQALLLLTTL